MYYYIKEKNYLKNRFIFQEGDPVDGLYLMVTGEIHKLKSTTSTAKLILSIVSDQEVLGLDELITGKDTRDYSIKVTSEKAFLLFISKKDFKDRILAPYPEIRKQLEVHYKVR